VYNPARRGGLLMAEKIDGKTGSCWSRFIACTVLVLYTLAVVVIPSVHKHGFGFFGAEICCGQTADPTPDDSDCIICLFSHVAVSFSLVDDPLPLLADVAILISLMASLPPVADDATALPPCRAPPVA